MSLSRSESVSKSEGESGKIKSSPKKSQDQDLHETYRSRTRTGCAKGYSLKAQLAFA